MLLDGKELPETVTDNVEVLTISGAGFSINWDFKAGDKVLLLGFKDYVEKVQEVKTASVPKAFIHYSRATIKALPMCVFNSEAKVSIDIKDGKMTIKTEGDIEIETKGNVSVKAKNIIAKCDNLKVTPSGGGSAALEVIP